MAQKKKRTVVTIADVASHAGISRTTVSYALTRPDRVSVEARERVQRAIDELGFVRNDAAHQLRAGRSLAIGLIVPNATYPVFSEIAAGAEEEAGRRGNFILTANSNSDPRRELAYLRFFTAQRVSAILLAPIADVPPGLAADDSPALVVFGHVESPHAYPAISGDDELGGYKAARHLIEQGRTRLLFVGGPHATVKRRLAGARRAASELAMVSLVADTVPEQSVDAGERVVTELLKSSRLSEFDGVMAGNDLLALGILNGLVTAGVDVPATISLVGYDDIEYSKLAIRPLTSVRHPLKEFGREAVKLALGSPADHEDRLFEPELVIRATSLVQ